MAEIKTRRKVVRIVDEHRKHGGVGVLRIELDGANIVCTKDHKIRMKNGRYSTADQLKAGDTLYKSW